ncbi:MAG: ion transporter [Bacteroidetes bacterium]|nr:MAG: ion transporter [Bacteroidota bacterium]
MQAECEKKPGMSAWREHMHEIIFEADTKAGKRFDIILLVLILLSVAVVFEDSVGGLSPALKHILYYAEWFFTIIFTIEYILRIYTIRRPKTYIFSFYGIIDLLSILPTFIGLFLAGTHYLAIIRMLRLLRVFRVLKLVQFIGASNNLLLAVRESRHKIGVFFLFVSITVTIIGSIMYIVEGADSGFTSIPRGIYWAIVTLTTVGYGDIAPVTVIGQSIASLVMLLGYAIIAVPTGIITSDLMKQSKKKVILNTQSCSNCNFSDNDDDASFCKKCGNKL